MSRSMKMEITLAHHYEHYIWNKKITCFIILIHALVRGGLISRSYYRSAFTS